MSERIKAVIFDLDGVITDTAEFHFRAWKRLAEEVGVPFSRADNEHLRGVSRRESLLRLLKGRTVDEATLQALMARKNGYYRQMLAHISPEDLLPGVRALLDALDAAHVPYAIASASRNASDVVERLGIAQRLAALVDGNQATRPKPAPDLFRHAAARLNLPPAQCLVIEDAAAGVQAALAAGMPCLAVGPAERFAEVTGWNGLRKDSLEGVSLADLEAAAAADEAWFVEQAPTFDPARQHHMETVFTVGNGYFCTRGSLEEGYPQDRPLTLAHGIFDDVPISVTELVNLPDWLDLTLTVDGHTFRLDQGACLYFRRRLDLRRGLLQRDVRWQAPNGAVLDLTFERFASYAHEHLGALRLLVTAVNRACRVRVAVGINGHVANEDLLHWEHIAQGEEKAAQTLWLHSRTRHSGLELATAVNITASAPEKPLCQQCPGQPRYLFEQQLAAGETLQIDKIVAYTASRDPVPQPEAVVHRALEALQGQTYEALKAAHIAAWADLWRVCDVRIEGDPEAQRAVRFYLFQLLIAAPQHDERVSIGAKALSGLGYRGHVFWDTEIFILPFFSFTQPHLARNMLLYRYHTLEGARRKAAANGFGGAQFAWESATHGDEVTPTWVPEADGRNLVRIWTGDIEIHISADIAYAIDQYWQVTGDDAFMRDYGAEIILDTARFWGERAEREEWEGGYRYAFRDVIGPDEYHEHVDNNIYTNRMAQWHLQKALEVWAWLEQHAPQKARALRQKLDLHQARFQHWQDVIDHVVLLHDRQSGLMEQFEGFFELEPIDPQMIAKAKRSMQVELGIERTNRSQVLKQPDVIMLLCLLRDHYDARTWQANWDAYVPLTDHRYGSSLGPSVHAWAACEIGRPDEGYNYFMLAARADLHDVRGNADDGLHAASAGGVWQALVFGFAGLRLTEDGLTVRPRLPTHWRRLAFSVRHRGALYRVDIQQGGEARITRE